MSGPLVHAASCPEPPPVVRSYPTRHGDRVLWCEGCCRCGIEPRPPSTPVRFEYPHPDCLDYLEETT